MRSKVEAGRSLCKMLCLSVLWKINPRLDDVREAVSLNKDLALAGG
jgi:hypothetical protein